MERAHTDRDPLDRLEDELNDHALQLLNSGVARGGQGTLRRHAVHAAQFEISNEVLVLHGPAMAYAYLASDGVRPPDVPRLSPDDQHAFAELVAGFHRLEEALDRGDTATAVVHLLQAASEDLHDQVPLAAAFLWDRFGHELADALPTITPSGTDTLADRRQLARLAEVPAGLHPMVVEALFTGEPADGNVAFWACAILAFERSGDEILGGLATHPAA